MASASGGQSISFLLRLVPQKHNDRANLRVIQRKLEENIHSLRTFVCEKNASVYIECIQFTENSPTSETEDPGIFLKLKVHSVEELSHLRKLVRGSTLAGSFNKFASKITLYGHLNPPSGLKFTILFPNDIFAHVKTELQRQEPNISQREVPEGRNQISQHEMVKGIDNGDEDFAENKQDKFGINEKQQKQLNRVPTKVEMIKKKIVIWIPQPYDRNISEVKIVCRQLRLLNGIRMKQYSRRKCLFSCVVELPVESIEQQISYVYEITQTYTLFTSLFSSSTITHSKAHVIDTHLIQRDFMYEMQYVGVLTHLEDIIFHDSCQKTDLKESVIQLEAFLEKVGFYYSSFQILAQDLTEMMKDHHTKETVLCLVTLSIISYKCNHNFFPQIKTDKALLLLKAINQYKLDDFPSSNEKHLPEACKSVSSMLDGSRSSLVLKMSRCQPFLDESFFNKWIQESNKNEIIVSNENNLKATENLVKSALNKLSMQANRDMVKGEILIFIKHLLNNSPVPILHLICKILHSGKTKEEQNLLEEGIEVMLCKILTETDTSSLTESIINIWHVVTSKEDLLELFKEKVENSIIKQMETGRHGSCILKVAEQFKLFDNVEKQRVMLKTISVSSNSDLHSSFHQVIRLPKFQDCLQDCDFDIFLCWFKTLKDTHLLKIQKGRLTVMYKRTFQLLSAIETAFKDKIMLELDNLIYFYVSTFNIKEMLLSLKEMETLYQETSYKLVCEDHLVKLLKTKAKQLSVIEALECLTVQMKVLKIDSRLVALAVCFFLEDSSPFQDSDNEFDCLEKMTLAIDVWIPIFSCNGMKSNIVKDSMTYKRGEHAVTLFIEKLQKIEIPYNVIKKEDHLKIKTLLLKGNRSKHLTEYEIDKLWVRNVDILTRQKKKIEHLYNVTSAIKKELKDNLPEGYDSYYNQICFIVENFDKMNPSDSRSTLNDLINNQTKLNQYIKPSSEIMRSKAYWNLLKMKLDSSDIITDHADSSDNEDKILIDICRLFEEISIETPSNNIRCTRFVCSVLENGNRIYLKEWINLEENSDIKMAHVFAMFSGCFPTITEEIKFAEASLCRPISTSCFYTLIRLSRLKKMIGTVDSMESTVKTFKKDLKTDPDFDKAITSFRKLLRETKIDLSFQQVSSQLRIVYAVSEKWTENTINVLKAVGKASTLIKFLTEIMNEDIRSLIDAVEDISEQHVSESTVSALIETKRFFKPLIAVSHDKCVDLLNSIHQQVEKFGETAKMLPSKIDDCMDNLHNLKSLYNSVTNRGEQTKQIIQNIVKQGKIHFQFGAKRKHCDFTVTYTQQKTKQEQRHIKTALSDFRSRALLLMNSDRQSKNTHDLENFVKAIDRCFDISEIIYQLYSAGHWKYQNYKVTKHLSQLVDLQELLREHLESWRHDLADIRKTYYLMNFVQGLHIHVLYRYFEKNQEDKLIDIVLRFIHPELKSFDIKECFDEMKNNLSKVDFLTLIGEAITICHRKLTFFSRKVKTVDDKEKRITEIVKSGRVQIVHLEEDTAIKTLLALYLRTSSRLPEPGEVLLCTRDTTWSEIELLLGRCFGAYDFYDADKLFCIAYVELLSNEIHFKLVDVLKNIDKRSEYLLAIICRGSENHSLLDEFYENVTKIRPLTDETVKLIFEEVCPDVCTYTSDRAGLGKSTTILSTAKRNNKAVKCIHMSGKIQKQKLIEKCQRIKVKGSELLHIDIGYNNHSFKLDTFLFELIILGFTAAEGAVIDLRTPHICIEIANTINNTLRDSLQTAVLFKRNHLKWHDHCDFVVSKELNSPVQIVCHYLICLDKGGIDKCDLVFSGEGCVKPLSTTVCRYLLQKYFEANDTFTATNICVRVLADQLKKMSNSSFFKVSRIRDMIGSKQLPNVKSSMVKALYEVTKELTSRSVDTYRKTQQNTLTSGSVIDDGHAKVDLVSAASKYTEHMIRWEESNLLIYVFHNQNIQTISPMYRVKSCVPDHIKDLFESRMKRPLSDFQKLSPNELQDILQKVVRTNPASLHKNQLDKLSKDYALTPDNLLKMVSIILRIKSRVPVLVMGETGCGKTSLIRYLATICEVDFDVVSIHAGVEEKTIIKRVLGNNEAALENLQKERWLFLDEINTSEYIGLISDMICHHMCFGNLLSPNLVILSACNPYKLRSTKSILTSGLKGKVKTDELSRLVYRVFPLPEILVNYVLDFRSLTETDEKIYIDKMVSGVFRDDERTHNLYVDLLAMSQTFARSVEETTSSVSLRDIYRCKILTEWFLETLLKKSPKKEMTYKSKVFGNKIPAIILSLSHCYICRFSEKDKRRSYLKQFEDICVSHCKNLYTSELIEAIIRQEQQDILSRMELPSGTAQNTALRENVFVILVCILNRIPIFVVGKPGSSKSLSLQVIKSNLRGKDSNDGFFQTLPQLYCVSFQGSESSTSDGILKVFEEAEKYQEANNKDDVLSVVILDEIGLAEISRCNPLKVLHNLLEPDGQSRPNVAVVGVSNWSLDASKMNRAIHLSRPDMDVDELFDTAKSISESFEKEEKIAIFKEMERDKYSFRTHHIENKLKILAESYMNYVLNIKFENFHGLRDYYSLVKYIANRLSVCPECPVEEIIMSIMSKGLERNFGGLPTEKEMLRKKFQIKSLESSPVLDLLKENAKDPLARHLMIITTADSALGIIEQSLNEAGREKKEILFGSQFEEDIKDDFNYRILSRIILCMEQGMVLILRNLENIYGSLYDMLNKNYSEIGSKKYCRVALGAYSNPICHVHDDFRCIVIANENDVDYTDPSFLNRFEKQTIHFSDVICAEQREIIDKLENWIDSLSQIEGRHFGKENCFPIYSKDMVASFVLDKKIQQMSEIKTMKLDLLPIIRPECIVRLPRAISESTRNEAEWLQEQYFALPLHDGISEFIKSEKGKDDNLMLIIFTNTSIHSRCLYDISGEKQIEKIGSFKSEKQLSSRIKNFWLQSKSELLFVQCSVADDEKHIMLAKSLIERNRLDYLSSKSDQIEKHVFLIIHLDIRKDRSHSSAQINFLSGWKLAMLDSIETPSIPLPDLHKLSLHEAVLSKRPLTDYVSDQLFWAFSRIKFGKHGRNVDSIERLLKQMKHSEDFIRILEEKICDCVSTTNVGMNNTAWQETVACDPQALETSITFMDALEKYITHVINGPLSKIIFQLEIMGVTQSYFIEDGEYITRKRAWMTQFSNEKLFSIKGIHDENGQETYECNTHDFSLKMPFSLYIYNTIESTSGEYLRWLATLKHMCNIDEDDELPPEVLDKLEIKQRLVISQELQIDEFVYSDWKNDYVDDFCNITSFEGYNAIEKQKRIDIMKWIIKIFNNSNDSCELEFLTRLHIVFWRFSNVFHNILHLLDVCKKDVLLGKGQFDLLEGILCEIDEHQTKTLDNMGEQTLTNENVIELYKRKQSGERNTKYDYNNSIESDTVDNTVLKCVSSNVSTKDTNVEHRSNLESNSPLEEIIENSETFHEVTEIKSNECSSNDTTRKDEHTVGDLNCNGSEIDTEEVGTTDVKGGKFHSEMGKTKEDSQENNDEFVKLEMIKIENIDTVEEGDGSAELIYDKNDGKQESTHDQVKLEVEKGQIDCKLDDGDGSVGGQVVENKSGNTDKAFLFQSAEANTVLEENTDLGMKEKLADDSHNEVSLQSDSQTVINDMQPLDRMVNILCKFMLPTKKVLLLYKGLENWHFKVNTVLRLAAYVSDHAPLLHSLRFCNDISTVLLQSNTPISIEIETFAQLLNFGKVLDSHTVFDQLIEIIIDLKYEDCQQLLSIFLMRCFALNPKTEALDYFLKAIMMRKLFVTNLTYLKLPMSTAILSEDDIFYVDLIETPHNCKDLPPLFRSLDTCLKCLNEDYSESSEFFTLIIDIFEEKFRDILLDEENNDMISLFLKSQILLKGEFGVSFLAAVAFCKVYVAHFIIDDGEYTEECLETVLPAFQFMDEDTVDLFLCKLLLKCFGREHPLAKVWLFLNSLKEKFPVFSKLSWSDKEMEQCFEICPLKVYSPQAFGEAHIILVTLEENKHLTEILKDLMKKGKESANNLIGIYGAATQYFYFQGLYSRMTDTKRMHASALVEASSCLGEESACLLKCIAGQEDFDVSEFNIHQGSSSTDFYLSNILISLFCVLLAEFENSDKKQSSILTRCLLKPKTVKCCFLPGMQNTLQSVKCIQDVLQKFRFHKCHCDIRVCAKKDIVCKLCFKEVSEENQVEGKSAENIIEPQSGYIVDVSVEDSMLVKVSPVMYQMLSLLTKGCIIGSVALGQATSNDLEEIGVPENGVDHLWSEIEKHWDYILGALNVSEYTLALIFHATLYKSRDFLCKNTTKMLEQSERSVWESQFKIIVEGILSSRFISIQEHFAKHNKDTKNTLEGDLRELNDIQELCNDRRREELTDMLRFEGKISMDNFYFEFEGYRDRYPFLYYVLQCYEELSQPRHIIPIVQWHLLVVSSVSYVMRRDECLKMTVNDFVHMPTEKKQRDHRRQRFDTFKKIWVELFKHIKDEELSSKYFPMNSQSKLSDCLILDEASVIYEVLLKLVKLQNNFLDTSLVLAQTCNSARFLCDGPDTSSIKCVDLGSISVKHLIYFDMTWECKREHEADETWEDFISVFTQSDYTYGCGQRQIYNFTSIEKVLAVKLLNGKAYINMKDSFPRIIFSDEFYKNFALLVSDLHGLIEQKHLPKFLKEVIQANNEKDPKMATELVKHLGIVMALMKKTSGEPDMSLIDYIDKWSTIMAHSFPCDYLPKPSNSLKLEHIVALHELLEELSANPIVDSLEDEFEQVLDADIESHMSNLIQNQFKLAEIVLGTIKRFVFRCLSVRDADPKQMLSSYIKDKSFWPVGVVSNGVISFGEERMPVCTIIPDGLMVSHVGSTVTFLETEIQDKKTERPEYAKYEWNGGYF